MRDQRESNLAESASPSTDNVQSRDEIEQLRMALAAARIVTWTWEPAIDRLTCSDNAEAIWGTRVSSAREALALVHPDDAARVRAAIDGALAGGEVIAIECRIVRPDTGAVVWIDGHGRISRGDDDAPRVVVGVMIDITERKQNDLTQAHFAALVNGVDDAIIMADADGRFIEANVAATRLLGYTREELLQMRVGDLGAGDLELHRQRFEALQREGRWRGEVDLRRKDGSSVPTESWQTIARLPATTAYISVWRDITARRSLDRQQQEFTAMVSHELKSPLTALRAYAQLMQRRGSYDERTVEAMIEQTDRLNRLVDDLLDASRLEADRLELQPARMDLRAAVARAVESAATLSAAHPVRLAAGDEPIWVVGDADRLGQVLHNLLTNAIKYSPDGGEVVARVEATDGQARVSVRDRGIGIPPAALPRVFERFYRAETAQQSAAQGIGLGLFISRRLVEAHGGRLWAESTPGEGSTFVFVLPLVDSGQ